MLRKASGERSKTIDYAMIVTVLGIMQANLSYFSDYIPQWANGLLTICVAVGIAYFRSITTEPLK